MNNICAGIVTFNPDIIKLCKNIEAIIRQVEQIFIVDNGSENYQEWLGIVCKRWNYIKVIRNKKNEGIAKALNQLCECSLETGYDWILTLDQDSICSNDMIKYLAIYIAPKIAIIAPNILYKNNERYVKKQEGIEEVKWVITSASLTNLKVWKELNGFDEVLFIDGVDRDFCSRAINKGYKVIKNHDTELMHELGNLECIDIFGKVVYVTHHSKIRKYYMVRNVIYLDKKLAEHRKYKYILKIIIKVILFEKNKIENMKEITRGIIEGRRLAKKQLLYNK